MGAGSSVGGGIDSARYLEEFIYLAKSRGRLHITNEASIHDVGVLARSGLGGTRD